MSRGGGVLTTRGRACLAAGLTLVLAGVGLGLADLTRVGVLLVALPAACLLLARRRTGIRVTRVARPSPVVAGDAVTVTLTIGTAQGRSTSLLLARERLPTQLGEPPRFLLGALAAGEQRTVRYLLRPDLRGRFVLGPLQVRLLDPFGLTRRLAETDGIAQLLVLPRVHRLDAARPPGTGIGAEGEIPHLLALHGQDDQSVREYRDGDDLRRIHWPATARMDELMVRQEDRPARRRAVVLLDPRADAHGAQAHGAHSHGGRATASSFEWAVTAAASIGVHLIELGYAVHLVSQETVRDGGADQASDPQSLLQALALAQTAPASRFTDLVRATGALTGDGGLLVALLADHDEAVLRQVSRLRQPGSAALAVLLDTATFAGPARPVGGGAEAAADLLRGGGWTTTVVGSATGIQQAWAAVTRQVAA